VRKKTLKSAHRQGSAQGKTTDKPFSSEAQSHWGSWRSVDFFEAETPKKTKKNGLAFLSQTKLG